jgi:high-affinity Fe2+/Pb2+ permease
MTANNSKTGMLQNAIRRSAKRKASAQKTSSDMIRVKRSRLTNEQLKARLIVFIGVVLAATFCFSVAGMLYALIFVTQPLGDQAPNDRAFIELLSTLTIFLTGALGSVLASNGLKDKATSKDVQSSQSNSPDAER